ncbi:Rad1/Rec1/Rad17 [Lipomyces tetrasporus]|uniref:Rad1/Rec1/Rad17 n=1 Tax=Lipomyces tetrasporus TaxID=54092 RepID=A0AAD7QL96_9ASCO|nr:Rad1/Rec1/Rad17 [Lipomyces tetrasporus]KAJ8097400.1 Rad1/Rec1/Rad17 [Lipomyces tetrasporus]
MVSYSQGDFLPVLDAVSTSVSYIFRVLKAVSSVSSSAIIQISADGLKVSVENSRTVQAHAFLNKTLFTSYAFTPSSRNRATAIRSESHASTPVPQEDYDETFTFSVPMKSLVNCFQIFGSEQDSTGQKSVTQGYAENSEDGGTMRTFLGGSTVCKMRYDGNGSQFIVMFDESGVTTTCALQTSEYDEISDILLEADAISSKIIMKANYLNDAFRELESTDSETVTVTSTQTPPTFVLISRGELGSVEYKYTRDRNVIETFVSEESVHNVYNFKMMMTAIDAIKLATKISWRTDEDGVTSIQCMCDVGDGRQTFIDFRFLPIYDEYEERTQRTQPTARSQITQRTQTSRDELFGSSDDDNSSD